MVVTNPPETSARGSPDKGGDLTVSIRFSGRNAERALVPDDQEAVKAVRSPSCIEEQPGVLVRKPGQIWNRKRIRSGGHRSKMASD